MTKIKL